MHACPESFVVTDQSTIYTCPGTAASHMIDRQRSGPMILEKALNRLSGPRAVLLKSAPDARP